MVEKQYYEDELANEATDSEEVFKKPGWAMEMPYWTVSAILHIFVILLIGGLIFSQKETTKRDDFQLIAKPQKEVKKYDPKKKRDMKRIPKILNPKIVEQPVAQREIPDVITDIPKGSDLDSLSNKNLERIPYWMLSGRGPAAPGPMDSASDCAGLQAPREELSKVKRLFSLRCSGSTATRMQMAGGRPPASTTPLSGRGEARAPTGIPNATPATSAGGRMISGSPPSLFSPSPATGTLT